MLIGANNQTLLKNDEQKKEQFFIAQRKEKFYVEC